MLGWLTSYTIQYKLYAIVDQDSPLVYLSVHDWKTTNCPVFSMVFLGGVLRHASVTPKQLYKRLLRDCEKLPKEAQNHYKHAVKQSFLQHVDEPDPQRVKDIIDKALKDAEWVLAKYSSN